ncbi:MAG: thioredoxin family protein [Planctomycetes bacterium]|nr:thioredoxin family protein [Planctomycetota bacterium]
MVLRPSEMPELGSPLPDFELEDLRSGRMVSTRELRARPGVLIAFLCAHCPYVLHIEEEFARLVAEFQDRIAIVAVSSNDVGSHPEDGPEGLRAQARRLGLACPYLFDRDQTLARAFRAACTPDFFLYDGAGRLYYRGQFDDARPGKPAPVTGRDLRAALSALLAGAPPPEDQRPSIGCNVKWIPGQEPDWFPA